jgi:hypothetical protein
MGWGEPGPETERPGRLLWFVQAALFGVAGLTLLLAPNVAMRLWPWSMTEPQSQLYSAFFLTLAVTSLLAAREPGWEGVRWLVLMITLLAVLVVAVSLIHLDRFTRPPATTVWLAVFAAEALVFGAQFVRESRREVT